ncbi:MAG: HAD-IB family hydrolase [Candidatus Paceibacterota bacterium]
MERTKKKVAVFDIDGTIFRSSLLIELVENLIDRGLFPQEARELYRKERAGWLDRTSGYEAYINAVVRSFLKHIKGVPFLEFDEIASDMVDRHRSRVYRFTRDLIAQLKSEDFYLLAISQSPKGVLDKFCDSFGFDKVYGRFYELGPGDRFTGKVVDEHLIANKANIVKRAVEKEGLTLEGSYGVGDTEDDMPFLELVTHPIAFNPNSGLYRYAKINDWRVVVERKDVIYEVHENF